MPPGSVGRHRASDGSPARRGSIEVWIAESERDPVEAARAGTLPDVMQLPMALAHEYARRRILNADAAQDVVRDLGQDTFSARALSLLTTEGRVAAVPSDGWGQLLIDRRDLFDAAGSRSRAASRTSRAPRSDSTAGGWPASRSPPAPTPSPRSRSSTSRSRPGVS